MKQNEIWIRIIVAQKKNQGQFLRADFKTSLQKVIIPLKKGIHPFF